MDIQKENMETLIDSVLRQTRQKMNIPNATYRIQFNEHFTFRDALAIVPYLHKLGISHVYASPILKARSGSTHGYDVCDHNQLSPALGTESDFNALVDELHKHNMGMILDIVPNHMGIGDHCNVWWMDVLENGPSSAYAHYFDIDWMPLKPEHENKVLLPILGDQYGVILEKGELKLAYEDGTFFLSYYDSKLPISPSTYSQVLQEAVRYIRGLADTYLVEFQTVINGFKHLPPNAETDNRKIVIRRHDKDIAKQRLAKLINNSAPIYKAIENAIQIFNGTVGNPRSFDRLHALIEAQSYRLAYWRVAAEEINYRRFFDINDLAAIRVELPEVFSATHTLIFKLLAEGKIDGLRIDHPDGLWSPTAYFKQLQQGYVQAIARQQIEDVKPQELERAVNAWMETNVQKPNLPLYVVAEKILSEAEPLPIDWMVHGTTGYDFVNTVNGLFVQGNNGRILDRIYTRFTRMNDDYWEIVKQSKIMTMHLAFASELHSLANELERINEKMRRYRDFTVNSLSHALREIIAYLPIYRTYVMEGGEVPEQDIRFVEQAVAEAKRRNQPTDPSIFNYVRDILLLRNLNELPASEQQRAINFVMKFQQVTGPIMAKSVEDTTYYIYNRLVSLNEVGGEPDKFGVSVKEFHRQNLNRLQNWRHTMLASSTHDTKRSEDVRARINVLSEIPGEWNAALSRWKRLNSNYRKRINKLAAPDRNEEYLLYQTIVGTLPLNLSDNDLQNQYRERITAYALKAAKEAKVHTSWTNPNEEYDEALRRFVNAILDPKSGSRFLEDITAFTRRIACFGYVNGLAQHLLKLTSPGMPDIYQGNETWDFSLVDPDNRRPVDYQKRQALIADNQTLPDDMSDDRTKLYVTQRVLAFRREYPNLFNEGNYVPLQAQGEKQEHLCAFMRSNGDQMMIVVVPRLVVGLTEGVERLPLGQEVWTDTVLSLSEDIKGRFRNLFTGEVIQAESAIPLAELLKSFPVALLIRE